MNFDIFIQKANENFTAAKICFEKDFYHACANRVYYAMFHISIAVLVKKGYFPPKNYITHEWAQASFSRESIHRRKIFARRFRTYLYDAQSLRNTADYYESNISKKSAANELKKADEFLTTLIKELTKS